MSAILISIDVACFDEISCLILIFSRKYVISRKYMFDVMIERNRRFQCDIGSSSKRSNTEIIRVLTN